MFSSQIVLSLSAIPLSLNLLQYISAEKSFGRLVIIIFEMFSEMMGFMWVFVLCVMGFSITFWGLFNHTGPYGFGGLGFTILQLFSVTMGSLNYPLIQVCVCRLDFVRRLYVRCSMNMHSRRLAAILRSVCPVMRVIHELIALILI